MSADNYPSIVSCQMEAIVYIIKPVYNLQIITALTDDSYFDLTLGIAVL